MLIDVQCRAMGWSIGQFSGWSLENIAQSKRKNHRSKTAISHPKIIFVNPALYSLDFALVNCDSSILTISFTKYARNLLVDGKERYSRSCFSRFKEVC